MKHTCSKRKSGDAVKGIGIVVLSTSRRARRTNQVTIVAPVELHGLMPYDTMTEQTHLSLYLQLSNVTASAKDHDIHS